MMIRAYLGSIPMLHVFTGISAIGTSPMQIKSSLRKTGGMHFSLSWANRPVCSAASTENCTKKCIFHINPFIFYFLMCGYNVRRFPSNTFYMR